MKWDYKEKDALCRRLAEDHVTLGLPIDYKRVYDLGLMVGQTWRPRPKSSISPAYYKTFLEKHREQIEGHVKAARAAKEAADAAAAEAARKAAEPPPSSLPATLPSASRDSLPVAQQAADDEGIPVPTLPGSNLTLGQFIDAAMQQQLQEALAVQARDLTLAISSVLTETFKGVPGFDPGRFLARPDPQRKRVVYVANADANQLESIQREFPFLEIRGVDRVLPDDPNAELVVGVNIFGTDGLDKRLRKRFGRKYAPAYGGADAAKRVISARLVDPRLLPKEQRAGLNHH